MPAAQKSQREFALFLAGTIIASTAYFMGFK